MMKFLVLISIISLIGAVEIIDLENRQFVLTKVEDSFLYDGEEYFFHIFDLGQLYERVKAIVKPTMREAILIRKARKYLEQLGFERLSKRGINILGTGLKWIYGIPDHDDWVELQKRINGLIENNNVLRENYRNVMEVFKNSNNGGINSLLLAEVISELRDILLTLNMAKNGQINTLALNLDEIERLIEIGGKQLPIINVLEYSTIHVCRYKNSIILVIKFPIIKYKCEHFRVTPLEYKYGKIELDTQISKCNNTFQRTKRCIELLNTNICQTEKQDNCTTRILQNQNNAQCNVKQEENEEIQIINSGHIILSGKHQVDNATVGGINLINFEEGVKIDSVLYTNFEKKAREYVIAHHGGKFEILTLIETEREHLKFKDMKALKKFIIPLEEHPIKTAFVIMVSIVLTVFIIWLLAKVCKIYNNYNEAKSKKQYLKLLRAEYEKRGLPLSDI